jgi:hypothetical protein
MKTTLFLVLIVVGFCLSAFAQSIPLVVMAHGSSRAAMTPATTPYTTGGPSATVAARALRPDVTPSAADFRIRSWTEGDRARVLVFAVTRKPGAPVGSDDERETQIASVAMNADQSIEVTATEKYNARPITLSTLSARALNREAAQLMELHRRVRGQ